jgi:hypothetical protein
VIRRLIIWCLEKERSLYTEDEARTKLCPFSFSSSGAGTASRQSV